ncbi:hypothetical protein, partial [Sphingobacterium faecium]|uniref:hypothetical protein n=1 Tax=Sphingobacterium faecium TaxID=34087 RepID=UPI003208F28E
TLLFSSHWIQKKPHISVKLFVVIPLGFIATHIPQTHVRNEKGRTHPSASVLIPLDTKKASHFCEAFCCDPAGIIYLEALHIGNQQIACFLIL